MENQVKQVFTKNMFIESCHELGLNIAKDLTEKIILEAYEAFLNQHLETIQNGVPINLNLDNKNQAKEYLLNIIKPLDKM